MPSTQHDEPLIRMGAEDAFLAHLVADEFYDDGDHFTYSLCGVDLFLPSRKKGEERQLCSMCQDIADGKAEPF